MIRFTSHREKDNFDHLPSGGTITTLLTSLSLPALFIAKHRKYPFTLWAKIVNSVTLCPNSTLVSI